MVYSVMVASFSNSNTSNKNNSKPWNQHPLFYIAICLPCLLGVLFAHSLSYLRKLSNSEIMTISIECGYQNTAIAITAAMSMFSNARSEQSQALSVPIVYGSFQAILSTGYCVMGWKLGWTKAGK